MKKFLSIIPAALAVARFENDLDAWKPERWANEGLMQLEPQLVMGNLVYRDFDNVIADFGDVVNATKPSKFVMKRKREGERVKTQDAKSTKVPVRLNQWGHVSFIVRDKERSLSFVNLIEKFIGPAMVAIARGIDSGLIAQRYAFLDRTVGKIGTALGFETPANVQTMANNLNWIGPRYCVITANQQGQINCNKEFITADKVGDDGSQLRRGAMGELMGTQYIMSQNNPTIANGCTITLGAINHGAGYDVGDTILTVDGFTGALAVGQWLTIAGDNTPHRITAHSETGADTTAITISPALKYAVADDAAIRVVAAGAIDLAAGYSADEEDCDDLVVDGFSVAPKVGQLVTFGSVATPYAIVDTTTPTTTGLCIDRPLEADLADDAAVNLGPAGNYGFAFMPNALALVSRPLAQPMEGTGARSAVINYNGLSLRVIMAYDADYNQTRVTFDTLYGFKVLDTEMGFNVLS